jgi:hypothetical protein
MPTIDNARASWRISEWLRDAGRPFSRAFLYSEIHAGRIAAVKAGGSTILLTSPQAYFASLPPVTRQPGWRRARKAVAA